MGSWYFWERKSWHPFDAAAQRTIEEAYRRKQRICKSTFFNPRMCKQTDYEYDLDKMEQTNLETGYIRRIRREESGAGGGGGAAAFMGGAAGGSGFGGFLDPLMGWAAAGAGLGAMPADAAHHGSIDTVRYEAHPPAKSDSINVQELTKWRVVEEIIDDDETCAVCICGFDDPTDPAVQFSRCVGHFFHRSCAQQPAFLSGGFLKCPVCSTIYGTQVGAQPSGTMTILRLPGVRCDGCGAADSLQIHYAFPHGVQIEGMPSPGLPYHGTARTAFLPDNAEGREVLELLKVAFKRGLVFTVGESITTGRKDTTVWAGIHHKTAISGGSASHGYPDPSYLSRVKLELAQKGVGADPAMDPAGGSGDKEGGGVPGAT